jgi:hypothetical protein
MFLRTGRLFGESRAKYRFSLEIHSIRMFSCIVSAENILVVETGDRLDAVVLLARQIVVSRAGLCGDDPCAASKEH